MYFWNTLFKALSIKFTHYLVWFKEKSNQIFSVNDDGSKIKSSVSYRCCDGSARASTVLYAPCEKLNLLSLEETTARLQAGQFVKRSQKSGINFSGLTNVTLFVPLDTYFTDNTAVVIKSNNLIRKPASTDFISKSLARSHMINDWIDIKDIEKEQLFVSKFDNITIRMNVFPRHPDSEIYDYQYRYTANCVPLVKVNQVAENYMVHVVERILTPVLKNIWDLIEERNDMEIFKAVLRNTKLDIALRQDPKKSLTVFAPTDKAFEKINLNVRRAIEEDIEYATSKC